MGLRAQDVGSRVEGFRLRAYCLGFRALGDHVGRGGGGGSLYRRSNFGTFIEVTASSGPVCFFIREKEGFLSETACVYTCILYI